MADPQPACGLEAAALLVLRLYDLAIVSVTASSAAGVTVARVLRPRRRLQLGSALPI